jgi:predicted house-cleaning noncanonical NTP pyrophosphatase (MazG superfamily)
MGKDDLITFSLLDGWSESNIGAEVVGCKALGISTFPELWRPPFQVIPTSAFDAWVSQNDAKRADLLRCLATRVVRAACAWRKEWPRGLILRSSASKETLEDRGAYQSKRLAGDFGVESVANGIAEIYQSFQHVLGSASLAIVTQPLVGDGALGHLSNERRVSRAANHWEWEQSIPVTAGGRVDCQGAEPPELHKELMAGSHSELLRLFRRIGRWVISLKRGTAHLEWAYNNNRLWLLQIDFEDDAPDDGVDPGQLFRALDLCPPGAAPPQSPIRRVDFSEGAFRWQKIENVRIFINVHPNYPPLFLITGDELLAAEPKGADIEAQLELIGHGRIICRTDCSNPNVPRLNLPRTYTVGSRAALTAMHGFLEQLSGMGAAPKEVCFILHKFIPAKAGAWVKADSAMQLVQIDSLWGVPDGLQYLPHDTFEYDIRRRTVSGGRIRYKPRFVQESASGAWKELRVQRTLARHRSLSVSDVREVAETSHAIASALNKSVLIMWFCGIPPELMIGRNLPWFLMPPPDLKLLDEQSIAPKWPKWPIRNHVDLSAERQNSKEILVLEPEVDLIRDDAFLESVIALAKRRDLTVELAGSRHAHAYYQLEKSGVAVLLSDAARRSRMRKRQSFGKLVRDRIPDTISEGGEIVVQDRLPKSELRKALVSKLFEESQEFLLAIDPDEVKGELADLLEILESLARITGVEWDDIISYAKSKRERRGSFDSGAVLIETSWPAPDQVPRSTDRLLSLRDLTQPKSDNENAVVTAVRLSPDRLPVTA